MPESRIFEGKTTNEAIEKGLKELRISKNDVEIKILENEENRVEKKNNVEKVKNEVKIDKDILENASKEIREFLDKFLEETIKEKINYRCEIGKDSIIININDKKADFLIGYRGETMSSLQVLLTAIATKKESQKIRVELDILGYREKRIKTLEELAEKIAKTVIKTRKSITLEPMTPYERKIIHTKLQNNPKVKTISIGEGMHRKVVVSLK